MRAQVLDGVEKLRLALRRGGGGVGVDKRAEVDDVFLGIIPGRIFRHVVAVLAQTRDIRLRAAIGEQQIEEEIIAELILLCDLRDALLNFPDAKRSHLGCILSLTILCLECRRLGWGRGVESGMTVIEEVWSFLLAFGGQQDG